MAWMGFGEIGRTRLSHLVHADLARWPNCRFAQKGQELITAKLLGEQDVHEGRRETLGKDAKGRGSYSYIKSLLDEGDGTTLHMVDR